MAEPAFTIALFDFDGVIVDSARLKAEAFVACFRDASPGSRAAIHEYVTRHGGVSRFAKFRYIHERILERPLSADSLDELCSRYSSMVVEQVNQAPFIPGAIDLLRAIHAETDCYVVSGTPEVEVQQSVRHRGLGGFFKGVLGSPTPKTDLTVDLVRRCGARPDTVVFLGDSITDYEAAMAAGIAFLGVVTTEEPGSLPQHVEVTDNLMKYRSRFVS